MEWFLLFLVAYAYVLAGAAAVGFLDRTFRAVLPMDREACLVTVLMAAAWPLVLFVVAMGWLHNFLSGGRR